MLTPICVKNLKCNYKIVVPRGTVPLYVKCTDLDDVEGVEQPEEGRADRFAVVQLAEAAAAGVQFNRHLGFRVGFGDKFRGNFRNWELEV